MNGKDFGEVVNLILKEDSRYEKGVYFFVRKALDYTLKRLHEKDPERQRGHVDGHELLHGIREYALEQFGPMAKTVFTEWGLKSGRDFGEIVFNLVDYGIFGKNESDKIEDFEGGLDFHQDLEAPFLPSTRLAKKSHKASSPSKRAREKRNSATEQRKPSTE